MGEKSGESGQAHKRAIDLESTNAFSHMACAILHSFCERHDDAVSLTLSPSNSICWTLMTNYRLLQANYYARRYDEAVQNGRIAFELTPDSPYTCFYLALSLAAIGLNNEAWDIATTGKKLNAGLPLGEGFFGYLAGALGYTIEGRGVLRDLQAFRKRGYIPSLPIAWIYLGWGATNTSLDLAGDSSD